jgi:hypothetical protein
MGIGESPSFSSQSIDIRCLYFRSSIATQIAVSEIVDEDQNDVGWRIRAKQIDAERISKEQYARN